MKANTVRTGFLIATCLAVLACGDDDGGGDPQQQARASILNAAASQIAAYALSDMPPQDFTAARTRLERGVPAMRTATVRSFPLGADRGAAVASDTGLKETRQLAARALGASIDPQKEADAASAQASMDALLAAVQQIVPAAASCDALPAPKNEACAIAFLILEVKRSEGVAAPPDAGVADTGVPMGMDSGMATSFSCGARDVAAARMLDNMSITASETWSGKILIKGRTLVYEGATITIMPGTEIFMDVDSSIEFGWNNGDATVIAEGTAAAPIKFCGKTADRGFWEKITVGGNVTSNSVLRNVLIAEGGGSSAALELRADILVDNLQVLDSGNDGVLATDFQEGSQNIIVKNAVGYPVVLEQHGAATRFPRAGDLTGNGKEMVMLAFNSIDADATFRNLGIPYLQTERLLHSAGALTIEAGVEWRANADLPFEIGWNNSAGSLQVMGTAAAPVVFRGVDDNTGWGGLVLGSNLQTISKLAYTEIRQGGKGRDAALQVDAAVTLDHVSLKDNFTGVAISEAGLAPGSALLSVTGTQAVPLTIETEGVFTVPTDSKLTGNSRDQIVLTGGGWDESGTVPNLGVPYFIDERWLVSGTSTLTFAPGVEVLFGAGVVLDLGWNNSASTITLVGSAAQPIKFRGEQDQPSYWEGVRVGGAVRSNSKFDYWQISNAGTSAGAALQLSTGLTSAIPITNTTITDAPGYCVSHARALGDYTAMTGNAFTCTAGPVELL